MKRVEIGSNEFTEVLVRDEPGPGNACHDYVVRTVKKDGEDASQFVEVQFQNGPVKEAGINGCHNEDLIAIVIHRLQGFQSGDFACEDNANTLELLHAALAALRKRTDARKARGVEGTNVV